MFLLDCSLSINIDRQDQLSSALSESGCADNEDIKTNKKKPDYPHLGSRNQNEIVFQEHNSIEKFHEQECCACGTASRKVLLKLPFKPRDTRCRSLSPGSAGLITSDKNIKPKKTKSINRFHKLTYNDFSGLPSQLIYICQSCINCAYKGQKLLKIIPSRSKSLIACNVKNWTPKDSKFWSLYSSSSTESRQNSITDSKPKTTQKSRKSTMSRALLISTYLTNPNLSEVELYRRRITDDLDVGFSKNSPLSRSRARSRTTLVYQPRRFSLGNNISQDGDLFDINYEDMQRYNSDIIKRTSEVIPRRSINENFINKSALENGEKEVIFETLRGYVNNSNTDNEESSIRFEDRHLSEVFSVDNNQSEYKDSTNEHKLENKNRSSSVNSTDTSVTDINRFTEFFVQKKTKSLNYSASHWRTKNNMAIYIPVGRTEEKLLTALNDVNYNWLDLPLQQTVGMVMLGITRYFDITGHVDLFKLHSWILSLQINYKNVPYHNWLHAVDTFQMCHCCLRSGAAMWLSKMHTLALLIASLGHDVGHPGCTNDYLRTNRTPLLRQFGQRNTLERLHYATTLLLMSSPECSFLEVKREETIEFRNMIYNIIIGTDLADHNNHIEKLDLLTDTECTPDSVTQSEQLTVACGLMHMSDISGGLRAFDVSVLQVKRLEEEFFALGDYEIEKSGSILFGFDREGTGLGTGQVWWIDRFVLPTKKSLAEFIPELEEILSQNAVNNIEIWQQLIVQYPGKNVQEILQLESIVEPNQSKYEIEQSYLVVEEYFTNKKQLND